MNVKLHKWLLGVALAVVVGEAIVQSMTAGAVDPLVAATLAGLMFLFGAVAGNESGDVAQN
jgi:nucleoside permease NupC